MKKIFSLTLLVFCAYFISGCSLIQYKDFVPIGLSILPGSRDLAIGASAKFYAVAINEAGETRVITPTWSSSYSKGTLDAAGNYTAGSQSGTDYVYASYLGFSDSATVSISVGEFNSLTVSPSSASFAIGDSQIFRAYGFDSYSNSVDVSPTWELTGSIGTFSANSYDSSYGNFTATASGSGYLIARYQGVSFAVTIEVSDLTNSVATPEYVSDFTVYAHDLIKGYPQAVVYNNGYLWVAVYDSLNQVYDSIKKYDTSGNLISTLGLYGTGEGKFKRPSDLAFDSEGNFYVADYGNHRIQKFNSQEVFVRAWGSYGSSSSQFYCPTGIAVDSNDYIYVTDGNYRVQKFDADGTFITSWGSYGIGAGYFIYPDGIAVDSSDNIYVVDRGNACIQKFDSSGDFINKWGSSGSGLGKLGSPHGLCLNASDEVFVADSLYDRINQFSSSGDFVSRWGTNGSGSGQFNYPLDIAFDDSGYIYVVDYYNRRIEKFKM